MHERLRWLIHGTRDGMRPTPEDRAEQRENPASDIMDPRGPLIAHELFDPMADEPERQKR